MGRRCGIINANQGRKKTDTERRVAILSVNRDNPERKTEKGKPGKPSMVNLRKEKGASPMYFEATERFICFALEDR